MSDSLSWPDPLLSRSAAISFGLSDGELARMVRRGELTRLQRGTYVQDGEALDRTARHAAVVIATARALRLGGAVSHASAAVLHGLPLWKVPLERVHITRRPPANGSGTRRVHLHVARLPEDDAEFQGGLLTTSVTRTVVDLARTLPFESAVVTADGALAARRTSAPELETCLARMGPVPGSARAVRVLRFADGRSESVGESRSRIALRRLGLPRPELQVPVTDGQGRLVGRCDFGWAEHRTVGEFDGRVKYGRFLRPGQTAADAVYEEKIREDAIRDMGWQVARWTWLDLDRPRILAERLGRAFARA